MKIKLILICSFCLFCLPWRSVTKTGSLLNSATWEIKQDGTGDFTTIHEGIDVSADTDTVLVYPGIYYENIIYNGKNITVASLELTTGNEVYIDSTIIDGQRLDSCVLVNDQESNANIQGFTLTNGQGHPSQYSGCNRGGGILTDAKVYSFDPTSEPGWTWLSFDILNTDSNDNLAQNLLEPISGEEYLDYARFKDHGNNTVPQEISYNNGVWQNGDHPITSPYGYKFCTFNDYHLTVFGERCSENTTFYLAGENEENWIGYFLLETQHIYDAFAGQLDNLTEIRAQHWAIKRLPGQAWPDVPFTLSPGDMVIACCENDVPAFSWNFEEAREKYIVSESQDFTFEEEADYIPVFISLDPEELPSEIGAYVDGECKGATVVQDTSAQICTYILENQGQNLTFEFSYGSRGQNKRIEEYIIYDPETSKTEKGSIQIDTRRDCYYVSFKGNQNETPAVTSIEITNYPNPFNPETKIEYSIPSESKIELSIYNIKGQKVKTLIKGTQQSGSYSIIWDGKDENEKPVGSGLYFYKLKTKDKELTKKMLLLK